MDSATVWASIQNDPVLPPPPGVTPNFSNPESRAVEIYIAAGICLPIIVLSAMVRFYAKAAGLRKWTGDDGEMFFFHQD